MEKIYIPWEGWEIVRKIGKGSYGTVYEICRHDYGFEERSAMKVLQVPQNAGDIDLLRVEGMDDESISNTYHGYISDMVGEYRRMLELKQDTNIVHVEDYKVIRDDNNLIWRVYIKMELLTPLLKAPQLIETEDQILKFAKDLCRAIAACHSRNIVHRDIKPQNIFCDSAGNFKLGDFGVSKVIENTTHATVGVGALNYMAPEVLRGDYYGAQADIYSVGMTLYWALNCHCTPFEPINPQYRTAGAIEEARRRRFCGESIPDPVNGSEGLKRIVLKALAYDPKDRYLTMQTMLDALESLSLEEESENGHQEVEPGKGGQIFSINIRKVLLWSSAAILGAAALGLLLKGISAIPLGKSADMSETSVETTYHAANENDLIAENIIDLHWDTGSIQMEIINDKQAHIVFSEEYLRTAESLGEDYLTLMLVNDADVTDCINFLFSYDNENKLQAIFLHYNNNEVLMNEYPDRFDWSIDGNCVSMDISLKDECSFSFTDFKALSVNRDSPDGTEEFIYMKVLSDNDGFTFESDQAPFEEIVTQEDSLRYTQNSWDSGEVKISFLNENHAQIELTDDSLEMSDGLWDDEILGITLYTDIEKGNFFDLYFTVIEGDLHGFVTYFEGLEEFEGMWLSEFKWQKNGRTIAVDLELIEDSTAMFSNAPDFTVYYTPDDGNTSVLFTGLDAPAQ